MLTHTGDPNKALLDWYKENEGGLEGQGDEENLNEVKEDPKIKFAKFKNAVDKVKEINAGQKTLLKKTATNVSCQQRRCKIDFEQNQNLISILCSCRSNSQARTRWTPRPLPFCKQESDHVKTCPR